MISLSSIFTFRRVGYCFFAFIAIFGLETGLFEFTQAIAATPPTHKEQSGKLPNSGSVVLRSGMEWMDEASPLFSELKANLTPLLAAKGLTVQETAPSSPAPLPKPGVSASTKSQKNSDLQLPLFTRSQQEGNPIMQRGGRIPGHFPKEIMADDAGTADYVILCRFASVTPSRLSKLLTPSLLLMASPGRYSTSFQDNEAAPVMLAASGLVKGVGTMGYGTPATPAPPASSYGNTPGDFVRGYEGNSPVPGDPWNREADLRARDYMFKNGPAPQYATPPAEVGKPTSPVAPTPPTLPKPPLPGDTDMPAVSPGPAPTRTPSTPSGLQSSTPSSTSFQIAGYALEMECYDLKTLKAGKKSTPIWRCTVHQRADAPTLLAALPGMIRIALGGKTK